ncbi:unnamed protein product [Ceutorhynchus assimilis]|uniref:Uncharacterized protein n=1 Tax=Ceutorhynchus assimilis TaxID=467358 RepID=A0A9N9MKP9_9CUCU|nr:unnamed protein product [Ceutorhynchus assimilis]
MVKEFSCKASYVLEKASNEIGMDTYRCLATHNHPANELTVQSTRFMNDLERAVQRLPGTTKDIFNHVIERYPDVKQLYTYSNVIGRMHHWLKKYRRQKNIIAKPALEKESPSQTRLKASKKHHTDINDIMHQETSVQDTAPTRIIQQDITEHQVELNEDLELTEQPPEQTPPGEDDATSYLRCSGHRSTGCRGRGYILRGQDVESFVLLDEHCHPPNFLLERRSEIAKTMKEYALSVPGKPIEIYNSVVSM